MKNTFSRSLRLVLSLLLLTAVLAAWVERLAIYDRWRLYGYSPPAAISALADRTTMNPATRRLFYVYHPELDDKSTFNSHCRDNSEQTIVLGCYIGNQGIYIFNVQDARLQGVLEVTAAHETLHAAYERLSSADKKHVDGLLNSAYQNITDQRIRTNIESYRKSGADVTNELHSILGTEVRDLPAELESYYARYFTNRQQIVSYSQQYESNFTSLQTRAKEIEQQLQALKREIDSSQSQLARQQAQLEVDRQTVRTQAEANAFNARVHAYNAEVARLNSLIDQYNGLVAEQKQLVVQQQQLFQAIDSRPSASQTQ